MNKNESSIPQQQQQHDTTATANTATTNTVTTSTSTATTTLTTNTLLPKPLTSHVVVDSSSFYHHDEEISSPDFKCYALSHHHNRAGAKGINYSFPSNKDYQINNNKNEKDERNNNNSNSNLNNTSSTSVHSQWLQLKPVNVNLYEIPSLDSMTFDTVHLNAILQGILHCCASLFISVRLEQNALIGTDFHDNVTFRITIRTIVRGGDNNRMMIFDIKRRTGDITCFHQYKKYIHDCMIRIVGNSSISTGDTTYFPEIVDPLRTFQIEVEKKKTNTRTNTTTIDPAVHNLFRKVVPFIEQKSNHTSSYTSIRMVLSLLQHSLNPHTGSTLSYQVAKGLLYHEVDDIENILGIMDYNDNNDEEGQEERNGIIVCHFLVRLAFLGTVSGCTTSFCEEEIRHLSLQALSIICHALYYLPRDVVMTFCDSIPYYLLNNNHGEDFDTYYESEITLDPYPTLLMKYIREYQMNPYRSYVAAHLLYQLGITFQIPNVTYMMMIQSNKELFHTISLYGAMYLHALESICIKLLESK